MGCIYQELHLVLVQLLMRMTTIGKEHINTQNQQDCKINNVGQRRAIPRRTDRYHNDLLGGILITLLGTNLNPIGTWLQMTQRKVIDPRTIANPFTTIDTILVCHIHGVIEIHLRKTEGNGMVQITKSKMVTLTDRHLRDTDTIQHGTGINALTADEEGCQLQGSQRGVGRVNVLWFEDGQSVIMSKEYHVVIGVHTYTI